MTAFIDLSIFKNKDFTRLFRGQILANFANWIDFLCLSSLLTFQMGLDVTSIALFTTFYLLPFAIVSPFAGVFVDRYPAKTTMLISNCARALICLCLYYAPDFTIIYGLVFLKSSFASLFSPAEQRAIKDFVPKEQIVTASSYKTFVEQFSKLIAPLLGGALISVWQPSQVFLLSAAMFILSLVDLARLARSARTETKPAHQNTFFTDLKSGLSFLATSDPLIFIVVTMASFYFAVFLFDAQFPLLLKTIGLSQSLYGYSLSSAGIGGVIGIKVANHLLDKDILQPRSAIAISLIANGLAISSFGSLFFIPTLQAFASVILLFFCCGFSGALLNVSYNVILQNNTTDATIGKITAFSTSAQAVCMILGPVLGAAITSNANIGTTFIVGGIGILVTSLSWQFIKLLKANKSPYKKAS